jgi:hypothetical protein
MSGKGTFLDGKFETCINFVRDTLPAEDRVFALRGKIEAYVGAFRLQNDPRPHGSF